MSNLRPLSLATSSSVYNSLLDNYWLKTLYAAILIEKRPHGILYENIHY